MLSTSWAERPRFVPRPGDAAVTGISLSSGGGEVAMLTSRSEPLQSGAALASLAQSAERFHGKEEVVGSIPTGGSQCHVPFRGHLAA